MKGFVLAEMGHVVQAIAPVDIIGGKTAQAFSLKEYQHVSILVLIGVSAAAFTSIVVNECSAADGTGAAPIPFTIYKQETAGASHDVLGAATAVTSAGYVPSANDGVFYVIELDAQALDQGFPYVQVVLANGSNSVIAACVAFLSGARFAETQSPTTTA
jgi:hypothetical protein